LPAPGHGAATPADPPRITVIDPAPAQCERLAREFGVAARGALAGDEAPCDVLVLAVKPQQMREALAPLAAHARNALVISASAPPTWRVGWTATRASCAPCPTRPP
jgi:pyrroline-5-carboxylate reductase